MLCEKSRGLCKAISGLYQKKRSPLHVKYRIYTQFQVMLTLHWPDMLVDRCNYEIALTTYGFGRRNFKLVVSKTEESIDARQALVYLLTTMKTVSFGEHGCVYSSKYEPNRKYADTSTFMKDL